MTTEELFKYTLDKVNHYFDNPKLTKGEVLNFNGAFNFHFEIGKYFLNFSADRGFIDVYLIENFKDKGIMVEYPELANRWANEESIDFIISYIYAHKDEIFRQS